MCGIAGIVGRPDPDVLDRMMAALQHRGPDDAGVFRDDRSALGHRRLAVIDPEGSRQPIASEDGRYHLVANGEIYNYRDLRRRLAARGHRFRTDGDSEVILHLYEDLGAACVAELDGMFAFSVWDAREGRLFLARDRLGIKPLLYAPVKGGLAFASEMKALLLHPDIGRDVDPEGLDLYLTFRFVPAPWTILRGVRKLPPGSTLTWQGGEPQVARYWQLPPPGDGSEARSDPRAADRLEALLADSVRSRLVSDVPLGAYLSGGLDSSLIVAMMSREGPRPVRTFSVGFRETGFDESRHARRVARWVGADHHPLIVERDGSFDELPRILWHLDEPIADAAAIPTYQMARLTKEHVTVVLTGEGADELFGGYLYYRFLAWTDALGPCVRPAGVLAPWSRLGAYFADIRDRVGAYLALKSVFTARERERLLPDGLIGPGERETARHLVEPYLGGRAGGDYLDRLLRLDLSLWLADDLLAKVDRMTMAHAVEARVPYLDHRLVEFAVNLPSRLKVRPFCGKAALRRAARRMLPNRIVGRRKRGFAVPVRRWLNGTDLARRLLNPRSVEQRGLFRPGAVSSVLAARGRTLYRRRQLWALVVLEQWCRVMLDGDPATPPSAQEGPGR